MVKRTVILAAFVSIGLFSCKRMEPEDPYIPWRPDTSTDSIKIEDATKLLMLTEQKKHRILLIDVPTRKIAWEWLPEKSGIPANRVPWFELPDEVKLVNGNILLTASRGGVALIRISDKNVLFYANPGGNPHSAELLPDGNIAVASSTGDKIHLYKFNEKEPFAPSSSFTIAAKSAHNMVWDKKRGCLWSAVWSDLLKLSYDASTMKLSIIKTYPMPPDNTEAHDLFPIYGEDALYVTTNENAYRFNINSEKFEDLDVFQRKGLKSISSGPEGYPPIITRPTTASYWTTEVVNFKGERIYFNTSYKIYKARWFVEQPFSR